MAVKGRHFDDATRWVLVISPPDVELLSHSLNCNNMKRRPCLFYPKVAAILFITSAVSFIAGRASVAFNVNESTKKRVHYDEAPARVGDVTTDPCSWPSQYRPLLGEEWIDRDIINVSFPATSQTTRAYALKRPGSPYAHAEFWDSVSGLWEPETFEVIRRVHSSRLPRGAHLDIGSWVGPTALYAARFASRVVAVEPDPRAFSELLANVRLNPEIAPRTVALRHCIGGVKGSRVMVGPAPLGSSMSRVSKGATRVPGNAESEPNWGTKLAHWPVECSSLAAVAAASGLRATDVALVKVDVEGAESEVLWSLLAWLVEESVQLRETAPENTRNRRPALLVELHTEFWVDPAATHASIARVLSDWRYTYTNEIGGQGMQLFDAAATYAATGRICKIDFCMVLATDEQF